MASASAGVRELLVPLPLLIPPTLRLLGIINTELAPIFSMLCLIDNAEPLPISIIAITAAIPITIPKVVNKARVGLRRNAFKATNIVPQKFIIVPPRKKLQREYVHHEHEYYV